MYSGLLKSLLFRNHLLWWSLGVWWSPVHLIHTHISIIRVRMQSQDAPCSLAKPVQGSVMGILVFNPIIDAQGCPDASRAGDRVRAQACPAASEAGRGGEGEEEEELHLCQNLETLTWQVGNNIDQ
eukprot:s3590_g11.t1